MISLNKLKSLIVSINHKIIKVKVASVVSTLMVILKANKIIKVKWTGKILENSKEVKKGAI